jgi:hypothetical protein
MDKKIIHRVNSLFLFYLSNNEEYFKSIERIISNEKTIQAFKWQRNRIDWQRNL